MLLFLQGVPILKAWQALPLGGQAIHQSLRQELTLRGTSKTGEDEFKKVENMADDIDEKIIEDIKVRLCFVTNIERGRQIHQIHQDASSVSGLSTFLNKSVPSVDYNMNGDTVWKIGA